MTHTPGPWTIRGTPGLADAHLVSVDGWIVADPIAANPQDIRLIVAAPDLLAALEDWQAYTDDLRGPEAQRLRGQARAAIAKATGTETEPTCPMCGWPATRNPWGGAGRCPDPFHAEATGTETP